jgi:hypothetical protein
LSNFRHDPARCRPAIEGRRLWQTTILRFSKKRLTECYTFTPASPRAGWRRGGANDVFDFLGVRIQQAERDKQSQRQQHATEAAANRIATLRNVAAGRPTHEKQIFAVYWRCGRLRICRRSRQNADLVGRCRESVKCRHGHPRSNRGCRNGSPSESGRPGSAHSRDPSRIVPALRPQCRARRRGNGVGGSWRRPSGRSRCYCFLPARRISVQRHPTQ